MWNLLKSILLKWAFLKALLRVLGSLGWLIPVAFVLKLIGVPLLILLAIIGIPLLIVLAIVGLPVILVVVFGGGLLAFIMWLLTMGLFALKLALPIIAIVWVVRWFLRPKAPPTPDIGEVPPTA